MVQAVMTGYHTFYDNDNRSGLRFHDRVPRYTLRVNTTLADEVADAKNCDRLAPDRLPIYGWSGNRGTIGGCYESI